MSVARSVNIKDIPSHSNARAVLSSAAPVVASQSTAPYSGAELCIYSHACPLPIAPSTTARLKSLPAVAMIALRVSVCRHKSSIFLTWALYVYMYPACTLSQTAAPVSVTRVERYSTRSHARGAPERPAYGRIYGIDRHAPTRALAEIRGVRGRWKPLRPSCPPIALHRAA